MAVETSSLSDMELLSCAKKGDTAVLMMLRCYVPKPENVSDTGFAVGSSPEAHVTDQVVGASGAEPFVKLFARKSSKASGSSDQIKFEFTRRQLQPHVGRMQSFKISAQGFVYDLANSLLSKSLAKNQ